MYYNSWIKEWLKWRVLRVHLASLAVSLSFNNTWWVPREAARFGALPYALLATLALVVVALPLTLLQLAVGQLSQQDAVGVWRAVPICKGVGYTRLLISFISSIYSVIYLALSASYFLYGMSNSIPFHECTDMFLTPEGYVNVFNELKCLNVTFMAPVESRPEYYVSMSFIIIFIWIVLPFFFYRMVKYMKRTFYVCGPFVIMLSIVVVSGMARTDRLAWLARGGGWMNCLHSDIWFAAFTQALITSEVAGGYLISAADSIYSNNNVLWVSVILIGLNIVVMWIGLVFFYAIGGGDNMNTSPAALLTQIYRVAQEDDISVVWPLLAFAALILSGVITMQIRMYPIYERIQRSWGVRWRSACAGASLACAGASVLALAFRWEPLRLLADAAVPTLAVMAAVLEILAFVCVYGWRVLMEDIEFLTGDKLHKAWVVGWCAAPVVLTAVAAWWGWEVAGRAEASAVAAVAAVALALTLVIVAAVATVAKQVQYDFIGKLKSSFKPSRHWGPRDPITHYYWRMRREDDGRREPAGTRYRGRESGQISGAPSLNISVISSIRKPSANEKKRSSSDDWLLTVFRRKSLEHLLIEYLDVTKRCRSKSVDFVKPKATKDDEFKIFSSSCNEQSFHI